MRKRIGEVGVDGVLSDFIDQSFEYGSEKFGRTSPVLGTDGSIMSEPGEQVRHRARASGIFERVSPGPSQSMSTIWGHEGVFDISLTTHRIWFMTDDLPVGFLMRKKLERNGARLAGHVRWSWVDFVAFDETAVILALAKNENARAQFVGTDRIEGVYRRALRIELDPPAATIGPTDLYAEVGDALIAQRVDEAESSTAERATLEAERGRFLSGENLSIPVLPGAVPWPFRSRSEFALPGAGEAIASRRTEAFLRQNSVPLRAKTLTAKERSRVEKSLVEWATDGTKVAAMRPWLSRVDRSVVLGIAADGSTAPEVLEMIATHGDPKFAASATSNPNSGDR